MTALEKELIDESGYKGNEFVCLCMWEDVCIPTCGLSIVDSMS